MISITEKAYAKINVGLRVTGKLKNGYHTLETLFQTVSLADDVRVSLTEDEGIRVMSEGEDAPQGEDNICYAAAELMLGQSTSGGAEVHVRKRVPAGAGLGGGSSDAAAVVRSLNVLCELGMTTDEMERISAGLGADVPFFIRGGCRYAEGTGDILYDGVIAGEPVVLVVVPPVHVDTGWAYGNLPHLSLTSSEKGNKLNVFDFGRSEENMRLFRNDFEPLIFKKHPGIGELKERLLETGAAFASLSGSGSAVYGFFTDEAAAKEAESEFRAPYRSWVLSLAGEYSEAKVFP